MSEYPLTLSSVPAYSGVKSGDDNIRVPQGTTTEEFQEYLKEYEPDTFEALEKIAAKYPPKELTPEEREKLDNTRLGNSAKFLCKVKPSTVKNVWSKFENWLVKYTSKSHNWTIDKVEDKIDTARHIWDLSTDNS